MGGKCHYQVVCAVVLHEGKVLCVQKGRTRYDYISFKWEFPGGKVEVGESPSEAIKRELLEELSLEVRILRRLGESDYSYPDFDITLEAFLCETDNCDYRLKEHQSDCWKPLSSLRELDWCAADVSIVDMVVRDGG